MDLSFAAFPLTDHLWGLVMSVRSGQSVTVKFTTRAFATGAATDATGTPTGVLFVNGVADAATVTVTKQSASTGKYLAQVTLPTLAFGDVVSLEVTATVSGVTDAENIWRDTKDIAIDSSGKAAATIAAGDVATDAVDAASVKADAVAKIQAGLATPTNITAGTITTVTNLTNAPTTGDLTATMKASVTTAATAATPTIAALGTQAKLDARAEADAALAAYDSPTNAEMVARTLAAADYATNTDMATLLSRVTASRAGYLDNLNVGGVVAGQADINALNQSASRRVILTTVGQYERPESGTNTYQIEARTYTDDGVPVNADTTPTLTGTGITSGSLAANIATATNPETGVYRWAYSVAAAATLEQARFDLSATISAAVQTISVHTQVADFVAATLTTADLTKLTAIYDKLPTKSTLAGTNNADGDIEASEATGNFPGSVASVVAGVTVTTNNDKTGYALTVAYEPAKTAAQAGDAMTLTGDLTSTMKTSVTTAATAATPTVTAGTVTDKTGYALTSTYDPAKTAAQAGDAMALTPSERSSTATAVWASDTRTLSSYGTLVVDMAAAVWAYATRILTAATNITSTGGTTVPQTGDAYAAATSAASAATTASTNATTAATAATTASTNATTAATAATTASTNAATAVSLATDIKEVTTKLDGALELSGGFYRYTSAALVNATASVSDDQITAIAAAVAASIGEDDNSELIAAVVEAINANMGSVELRPERVVLSPIPQQVRQMPPKLN